MSLFKIRAKLLNKKEVAKALWHFLPYQLCKSMVFIRWMFKISIGIKSSESAIFPKKIFCSKYFLIFASLLMTK